MVTIIDLINHLQKNVPPEKHREMEEEAKSSEGSGDHIKTVFLYGKASGYQEAIFDMNKAIREILYGVVLEGVRANAKEF